MKKIKNLTTAASALCFFIAILGTDTSLMYTLLIFPAAVLMWLSGGCYSQYYCQGKHYRRSRR